MDSSHWSPTAERAQLVRERIAANLRRERRRKGLTQNALSTASGVGRDTIVRLEAAKREPRILTLVSFSFALRVSLQALLAGLPEPDL
jgi:transcriptional regulator with XRE-family HTH domain